MRATMRRVREWVRGSGRWVRPSDVSVAVLLVVVGGAALAAGWLWHQATRSAPPARTLALAASLGPRPPALDSALEVTWTWSVGGTAALEERWLSLVAPTLPPGLCLPPSGDDTDSGPGALDRALRRLDAGVTRGAPRDELERRLMEVREAAGATPGRRGTFLVRYNLARGHAAAGDWATAAELLEPVFRDHLSADRVPETRADWARGAVVRGEVDRALAVDAFHGRYLAGAVAYHRGEPEAAIGWFRRAINAVHYLLALEGGGDLGPDGHEQRVPVEPGPAGCGGSEEPLTSLDAYAGLVASYMAAEDFRDPGGLSGEVARSRLEVDPDDPFAPVLEYARRSAAARGPAGRGGTAGAGHDLPENLLWAASNLQRVYHANRIRPDPRLEVTRAVLLLHLTRDAAWAGALRRSGGAEPCRMLGTLATDLHRDAAASGLGARRPTSATDSARAAVAVQTFARLERECDGGGVERVEASVRSAWLRRGGGYLTRGLGSRYETVRVGLVDAMAAGGSVPVVEERVRPGLQEVEEHMDALRRNRIPPDLPADLPVDPVRRYTREWWEAVFADVATTMAEGLRAQGEGPGGIRSGEVPDYLAALESAVAHAGLRPGNVYRTEEVAGLAAAVDGWGGSLVWTARTWIRNRPVLAAGLLSGGVLLAGALALLAHVSWWRYRLLRGQRLYVAELRARVPAAVAGRTVGTTGEGRAGV